MSYQELRSLVTTLTGLVVVVVFGSIVLQRYGALDPATLADGGALLRFCAIQMLIFAGISIAARIVARIILAILYRIVVGEDIPDFEDERDKLIELKVNQIGQAIFVVGFIGALLPVALGQPATTMFITFVAAGLLAEIVSETTRIVMYRRGA